MPALQDTGDEVVRRGQEIYERDIRSKVSRRVSMRWTPMTSPPPKARKLALGMLHCSPCGSGILPPIGLDFVRRASGHDDRRCYSGARGSAAPDYP